MAVRHVTLAPNVVTTVTSPTDVDYVGVFHKGIVDADVWATVNGPDPVAEADDTYLIPAGTRRRLGQQGSNTASVVKLLSTGAAKLEVEFG